MVAVEYKSDADLLLVFLQPNCSLSWRQSLSFFLGIAGFALLIALAFTVLGYWLILPFAGAEVIALGVCLYLTAHAAGKRQVITVTSNRVLVEKGRVRRAPDGKGGPEEKVEFVRAWTRVRLRGSSRFWHPSRLVLNASGQEVEIGEFLTEEEKQALAEDLGAAIPG